MPLAAGDRLGPYEILGPIGSGGMLATIPAAEPVGLYMYHLVCSEIGAAIDCYAQGIEQRNLRAMVIASAGFLKPLSASPRWRKLARMMNLPGTM